MPCTVMAVIVGALCFSVGEGLRLTPFPVSSSTENAHTEKNELSHYGPLDVPAQTQKRSKRPVLDLACPDTAAARKPVTSFSYLFEYDPLDSGSPLLVSRSKGRAPPFLS